ncbi:MAG: LysR family transcriptional regulator [Pseudobdellovibrionaceae bacterium]
MELLKKEMLILCALAKEKSVSKAAHSAGLQQPAVSKILSQLEHKLDRKLFARVAGGLQPSPFALDLVGHIEEIKNEWEEKLSDLLGKEKCIEGHFFIGCHPIIGKTYLSQVIPELLATYPRLNIGLVLETSREITEKVASGTLHFGLVANPVKRPDLIIRNLNQESVHIYQNGKIKAGSIIYFNPEMIDIHQHVKRLKEYRMVEVKDYHIILEFALSHKDQGAILPSTMAVDSSLSVASPPFMRPDIKLIYRRDFHRTAAYLLLLDKLKGLVT